mmetsp:Transcript_24342/g.76053  ORF Transcript_24342/g.76053 Transcript_24342/m.76053 type:complete len:351 (-) Transcript_24342:161-1213(-)
MYHVAVVNVARCNRAAAHRQPRRQRAGRRAQLEDSLAVAERQRVPALGEPRREAVRPRPHFVRVLRVVRARPDDDRRAGELDRLVALGRDAFALAVVRVRGVRSEEPADHLRAVTAALHTFVWIRSLAGAARASVRQRAIAAPYSRAKSQPRAISVLYHSGPPVQRLRPLTAAHRSQNKQRACPSCAQPRAAPEPLPAINDRRARASLRLLAEHASTRVAVSQRASTRTRSRELRRRSCRRTASNGPNASRSSASSYLPVSSRRCSAAASSSFSPCPAVSCSTIRIQNSPRTRSRPRRPRSRRRRSRGPWTIQPPSGTSCSTPEIRAARSARTSRADCWARPSKSIRRRS